VYQEFLDKFGKLPFSVKNTDKYIVYSPKSLGLVHAHLLFRVTLPASSMCCLTDAWPGHEMLAEACAIARLALPERCRACGWLNELFNGSTDIACPCS
jgi:hypothetical protein